MKDKDITGFTLTELLISIFLVALITTFAIPAYLEPTLKTQQSLAKIALFQLANALQEYYLSFSSYENVTLEQLNYLPISGYKMVMVSRSKESFMIAAVPLKANPNDHCGSFYLNQDGNQSISGDGCVDNCW